MEIYDLDKLPRSVGTEQSFSLPPEIPFNNLGAIVAIVASLLALVGIGIIWYTLVLYQRDHNLRVLVPGLVGGGFILAIIIGGALTVWMDATHRSWLLRLDEQRLMINSGPYALSPKNRQWLPGSQTIISFPYGELESVRALDENYYYPNTVVTKQDDDLTTRIERYAFPALEIKLKNPASQALRDALAAAVEIRQELAARSIAKLGHVPFQIGIRLIDDTTLRIRWPGDLTPDRDQALALLGKQLPVQAEANIDTFPATPFANTLEAWRALDDVTVKKYAQYLIEQGDSDSAGTLCWQLLPDESADIQGLLRRLVIRRDPAKGGPSLGDGLRQYITAVKWMPVTLTVPLVIVMLGLLFAYQQYATWQEGNLTRGWVAVPGVISVSLKMPGNQDGKDTGLGAVAKMITSGKQTPNIVYTYTVNGREEQGRTITLASYRGIPYHPSSLLDRYTVGREVTVYYNPAQPSQSVLEVCKGGVSFGDTITTLSILVPGLLMALVVPFLI